MAKHKSCLKWHTVFLESLLGQKSYFIYKTAKTESKSMTMQKC